jgi:hypothetical protein
MEQGAVSLPAYMAVFDTVKKFVKEGEFYGNKNCSVQV